MNEKWKKEVLSNNHIDQRVLKYYRGKQSIMMLKDEEIESILKTLVENKNDSLREFYFFVFNKICTQADGFLGEEIGDYCIAIVLNNPTYVFEYFAKKIEEHDYEMINNYADNIGYELYCVREHASDIQSDYISFKSKLEKASMNFTAREKNALVLFLKRAEIMIKKMDE